MTKKVRGAAMPRAWMPAALCALVLSAPSVAGAQSEVVACANKRGKLRVVSAGATCKKNEQALSWNREGPTGPIGPSGPPGRAPVDVTMLSEQWGSASLTRTVTWPNQPLVQTELLGDTFGRTKVEMSGLEEARLVVNVAAAGAVTPAEIRAQYSTDQTTWASLDGGTGPAVSIETAGLKVSPWVSLVEMARGDVYLRLVGVGGDGVTDPGFGKIVIQLR